MIDPVELRKISVVLDESVDKFTKLMIVLDSEPSDDELQRQLVVLNKIIDQFNNMNNVNVPKNINVRLTALVEVFWKIKREIEEIIANEEEW